MKIEITPMEELDDVFGIAMEFVRFHNLDRERCRNWGLTASMTIRR